MGHLLEGNAPNPLAGLFGGSGPASKEAGEKADTYIFINATCVELLNVRTYIEKVGAGRVGRYLMSNVWAMARLSSRASSIASAYACH